jgi:hydrogenase expression/formation protein HypE
VITGPPGDHAVSIMVARGEFEFEGDVESDCQPLDSLLPLWGMGAKWMRDITRGGLATILCELSEGGPPAYVEEARIKFSPSVQAVSEILGIDPLYLASEGKAVIVVGEPRVDDVLHFLKSVPIGKDSSAIGKVGGMGKNGEVILKTRSGGLRLLEPLTGELLPRIC